METSTELSSENSLGESQMHVSETAGEETTAQLQDYKQTIGKLSLDRDKALSEVEQLKKENALLKESQSVDKANKAMSQAAEQVAPSNLKPDASVPKAPAEDSEQKAESKIPFSSYPKEMQDVMIRETVNALGYSQLTNDEINAVRQFVESDNLSVEKAFHLLLGQSVIEQNQKESVSGVPYEQETASPDAPRKAVENLSMDELTAEMQRING